MTVSSVGVRQPEFGQRLRRLRQERGLSQRDVAGTVVNPSYISLLESGARVPTLEVVLQIAGTLGVSPEDLAGISMLPNLPTPSERRARPEADTEAPGSRLVHEVLARSAWDVGAWDEAQARHERIFTEAGRVGDPAAILEHGIALHDVLNLRGDHLSRYDLLVELVRCAEEFGVAELIVKLRLDQATAARDCGKLGEALGLAESAMAVLPRTELASTAEHVRALGVLVSVKVDSGDTVDIDTLINTMLDLADSLASPTVQGRSHWAASIAYARMGQGERAHHHISRAHRMLAHPDTSLRDWGRFARAAASALLDTDATLDDIAIYIRWMRAAAELSDSPHDHAHTALIEARYALRTGDAAQALELTSHAPQNLTTTDVIRHHLIHGQALHQLGRTAESIDTLRSAAQVAEQHTNYRLATQIWREIDRIHSATPAWEAGREA
ncbi:helix-turn-helix domain-containing protein [Actinokineospora sp. 24-640]